MKRAEVRAAGRRKPTRASSRRRGAHGAPRPTPLTMRFLVFSVSSFSPTGINRSFIFASVGGWGRLTLPRPPLPMGHGDGPRKGRSGKSTHVHGGKHVNRGGAFKAHRNVKRAVRDVEAENALRSRACAGVCRRCVQKVTASIASQPSPTSPPPVEKHLSPDPTLPRFNPPRRSSGGFSLASTRRGRPATRATAGSASSRRWCSRTGRCAISAPRSGDCARGASSPRSSRGSRTATARRATARATGTGPATRTSTAWSSHTSATTTTPGRRRKSYLWLTVNGGREWSAATRDFLEFHGAPLE